MHFNQLIRHGTGLVTETLRLKENHLKLGGGVNVYNLIARLRSAAPSGFSLRLLISFFLLIAAGRDFIHDFLIIHIHLFKIVVVFILRRGPHLLKFLYQTCHNEKASLILKFLWNCYFTG